MRMITMMTKQALQAKLKKSDLVITFIKKDGSTRVMNCTSNIPESYTPKQDGMDDLGSSLDASDVKKPKAAKPDNLMTVFDTDAHAWRSFYLDSIQSIEESNTRFGLLQE